MLEALTQSTYITKLFIKGTKNSHCTCRILHPDRLPICNFGVSALYSRCIRHGYKMTSYVPEMVPSELGPDFGAQVGASGEPNNGRVQSHYIISSVWHGLRNCISVIAIQLDILPARWLSF